MQQNSKRKLFGERDEIVNYIVSKYHKLAQKKFKTSHEWVGRWSTGNYAKV